MLPVLLDVGFVKIYTQGIFLVLAFLWGSFLLWKHISLTSYKEEDVFDGLFVALFGSLLMGRLLFVMFHFEDFGFNLLRFLLLNGYPGLNGVGLVLGFILFLYIFTSWKKISFLKLIDYVISPFLLALGIVKLGSFFSGSEIGSQTKFMIALKYPNLDGTRHLTPLYESVLFFLGSFLAYRIMMLIRREKYFEGFNLLFFIWYFALVSTAFDPIKAFKTMMYGYSFEFVLSSVLLLTVSIYFIYYFRASIFGKAFSLFKKKGK